MTTNTKAAQTQTDDPVGQAQAEVLRLRDRDLEVWLERRQRVSGLLELEQTSGAVVAGGGSVAEAGRLLAEGRAGLDVLDRAADEVTRQREAAIPLITRAQAAVKRAREAALRAEVLEREPRTRKLLADLREFERCDFAPAGRQPGEAGPFNPGAVVLYNLPLTQRLVMEADELAAAAGVLERQELNRKAGGQVQGMSVYELVVAVLGDGQRVCPALREVERWARDVERAGRERLRRTREGYPEGTPDPDTAPATWTLTWRGHEIVAAESRVSFLGLAASAPADDYGDAPAGLVQVGERSWMRPDGGVAGQPGAARGATD